jgi:hypothetical protein
MNDRTYLHTQDATWRSGAVHARPRSSSSLMVNEIAAVMLTKPGTRAHFPGITATTRRRIPL